MIINLSRVAFAVIASASFSAAAETIVESQMAEADIIVSDVSTLGLTITPLSGLTVKDLKNITPPPTVATFTLTGDNAAVSVVNPHPLFPYCTKASGTINKSYTVTFCLAGKEPPASPSFDVGGKKYYKYPAGTHNIRGGGENETNTFGPDTYKITLEAVKYTL